MARPKPSQEQLRAAWDIFVEEGCSLGAAARRLKMPPQTLSGWMQVCERDLGWKRPPRPVPLAAERAAVLEERLEQMRIKAQTYAGQLQGVRRQLIAAEEYRQSIFRLKEQPLEPPTWTIKPGKANAPGIPILFTSDFQWGEVIRGSELDGINEFNPAVASRRYRRLIEKTIELATQHMVNPSYPGIIYLRGGDSISGEIHADLRESNALQSVPAVRDLVEHEIAGLRELKRAFGRVHVVSVPGNHGRTTIKPQSKGYTERNMDTLAAWWIESEFRGDKAYTWQTPQSGDAIFPVYGFRYLLTHGDRIGSRGGEGFIGAVATITRGMKKLADYYASLGVTIDRQFIGHFHTSLELEYGFANGSLPGFSEFARDFRMRPQEPKQWLLFCHAEHGITARWPILLEPRPMLKKLTSEEHVFA